MPHSTLTLRFLCESNQLRFGALLAQDTRFAAAGWSVTAERTASLYLLDNFCVPRRLPPMALLPGRSVFVGHARDMEVIAPSASLLSGRIDPDGLLALLNAVTVRRGLLPADRADASGRDVTPPRPAPATVDFQRTCVDALLSGFTAERP